MLVVATNAAGDTRVSSDGFLVRETETVVSGVTIKDGKSCDSTGTFPYNTNVKIFFWILRNGVIVIKKSDLKIL